MTREEAIKQTAIARYGRETSGWSEMKRWAELDVDLWVKLGMLKLDEPKSARDRAEEAVRAKYIEKVASDLFDIIDAAGCKIVEK